MFSYAHLRGMRRYYLSWIAILYSLITAAQVEIAVRKCNINYHDDNSCDGFSFSASVPEIIDTASIFQNVNDSILKICETYYKYVVPGSFPEFATGEKESGYMMRDQEIYIDHEVTCNNVNILSICLSLSWEAGCGGNGLSSEVVCFNIDLRKKKFIKIEDMFQAKYLENVDRVLQEDACKQLEQCPDSGFWPPRYIDFSLSDTALIAYYSVMATGSKSYYRQVYTPVRVLEKYLIREKKIKRKGTKPAPSK